MAKAHTVNIDTNDIRQLEQVANVQVEAGKSGPRQVPVSPCTDWVTVNSDASINSTVTIPGDLENDSSNHLKVLRAGNAGTSVLVRMRYPQGVATASTVKVFGFDSSHVKNAGVPEAAAGNVAPKPELLPDVDGNVELTLTPDVANDPQDADGNAYTLSKRVDFHGNYLLIFPSTSAGQGAIEARII